MYISTNADGIIFTSWNAPITTYINAVRLFIGRSVYYVDLRVRIVKSIALYVEKTNPTTFWSRKYRGQFK